MPSATGAGDAGQLGPMMTGIVMTGRTGASFAAVLGTMTVNEEVDALVTMGLRPTEFLVLPRVLATALMLPAPSWPTQTSWESSAACSWA